jgi:hypothetical protein
MKPMYRDLQKTRSDHKIELQTAFGNPNGPVNYKLYNRDSPVR